MTVSGVVLDENNAPMAGVTVVEAKSFTGAGTTSDAKGTFRLVVGAKCDSLRFSFVGYKSRNISVRDAALVRMQPDAQDIGEVVVTGIFTRKEESYTGSAITLKSDDLKRVGNQNVFQSLKNLDPSLNILTDMTNGSDPNSLPDMKIRGTSTFPSNNEGTTLKGNYIGSPNAPLFIVDGFETTLERVFDMDMNRIESVTLLKDAAAKALYGSKASNGVVVIETRKLLENETRVTYTGSLTLEMPDLSSYNLCDALEKLRVEQLEGYYRVSGAQSAADAFELEQLYNQRLAWAQAGNSVYWLSKPLHTGVSHKHSVSVELGGNALRSIADFSYGKTNGVMKGSDRQNVSGDISLQYRYKKVLFKNIMSIQSVKSNDSPYGTFSTYARMNPYWTPYNSDGTLKQYLTESSDRAGLVGNPLYDAMLSTKLASSYVYLNDNFYVEAELVEGLKAVASIGISAKRLDSEEFYPANHSKFIAYTSEDDQMRRGSYTMTDGKSSSVDGKFDLQYNRTFRKRHALFADLSFELAETRYSEYSFQAEGFPSDRMNNIAFARQYAEGTTPSGSDAVSRDVGLLGYLSYSYDNRYLVDATYRLNGSSVFGNDNPWANFYSLGVGWNLHNERFMRGVERLRRLKLRASYGITGNQNFQTNTSFAVYTYNTANQYNGFIGALLQNMENPNLAWEQKKEWNVGLDLEWGPFNFRADYYDARTSDMVTSLSLAPSTGFSTVKENLGEVRNQGVELYLNVSLLRGRNGFLNVNGSIATNRNRITKLSAAMQNFNNQQLELAAQLNQAAPVLQYVEGKALNTIWAVPSLGIDPMTGREVFVNSKGEKTYTWSASDMVDCGSSDAKYNGIVGLNGEYKGFGLSLAATFFGGGYYYNQTVVDLVEDADITYNVDRRVLTGRWQTPGQTAQYSTLVDQYLDEDGVYQTSVTRASSRFVQRRNELEISSISAYYDFRQEWIRKIRLQRLRLSVYLNNVATFSTVRVERGTSYPFARTLSFSLTATF